MKFYLDNIRGFKNQFIEISDMNFLVGENSTGKTSFLSIISLLSDTGSSISGHFKNRFVNLGLFEEIINKKSTSSSFYIGMFKQNTKTEFEVNFRFDALILKFEESNGFPDINTILFNVKKSILIVQFIKNDFSFKLYKGNSDKDFSESELISIIKEEKSLKSFGLIEEGDLEENKNELLFGQSSFLRRSISQIPFYLNHGLIGKKSTKAFEDFKEDGFYYRNDSILKDTIWIDPIRTKPLPLYQPTDKQYSPEGEHIPTLLRDIFETKGSSIQSKKIFGLLKSFGKASGLFDDISIDKYKKRQKNSPFDINISLHGNKLKISNVGYGVSQILPILTEIARQSEKNIFLIQQPEVHLHPKSQAYFGEFLFDQLYLENKTFFVETHSDFLIDRFRYKMNRTVKSVTEKRKINVLFFESDGNHNSVHQFEIESTGNYSDRQPSSFRNFFINEGLNLLQF